MFSKRLAGAVAAALAALGAGPGAAEAQLPPIVVSSAANGGPGTLRAAINQANMNANRSFIVFNLPAAATVITPTADLPAVTAPVEIDGYTQAGSAPASATGPAQPIVMIEAVNTTRALELNTNDSLIRGLTIIDSSGAAVTDGIQVVGDGNEIEGNHIGTSVTGLSKGFQNLTTGVAITGDENVVGGGAPDDANVIAEGNGDGVTIAGDHNKVLGNRLGLPYGAALGNAGNGVTVTGNENVIGTQGTTGGSNVISQNGGDGVAITGNTNRVEGNYVGVDATGAGTVGNVGNGISFVGDDNLALGNVSSGNDAGVFADGISNTIMSNTLGTDAARAAAIGNNDGVHIAGGFTNVVGGDEGNFIAGNTVSGVEIAGGQNHRVEGNDIGSAALPNGDGVLMDSSFNTVTGNVLSGNVDAGVKIDGDAVGPPPILNVVDGNEISGNQWGVVVEDSHRNAVIDNAISGNSAQGVLIEAVDLPNANENRLSGNTIKSNVLSGVEIDGGDENLVGELDEAVNTITGNGVDGVTVATGQLNAVVNNSIYDNAGLGIDLGANGVTPNDGLGDPDAGPNGLQNHPIITGRTLVVERLDEFPFVIFKSRISWTLRSTPATDYRLEFYLNDTCAGRGEAKELISSQQVTTDANGLAEGSIIVDVGGEEKVTTSATVTDPNGVVLGPTSELSPCG